MEHTCGSRPPLSRAAVLVYVTSGLLPSQLLRIITVFSWVRADVMWGSEGWSALLGISLLFGYTTAFVNLGALTESSSSR